MSKKNNVKLLSQKEVAKRFSVSENTVKRWRENQLLSYVKVPGSRLVLFYENEINEFITDNTKPRKEIKYYRKINETKGKPRISSDDDWRID